MAFGGGGGLGNVDYSVRHGKEVNHEGENYYVSMLVYGMTKEKTLTYNIERDETKHVVSANWLGRIVEFLDFAQIDATGIQIRSGKTAVTRGWEGVESMLFHKKKIVFFLKEPIPAFRNVKCIIILHRNLEEMEALIARLLSWTA